MFYTNGLPKILLILLTYLITTMPTITTTSTVTATGTRAAKSSHSDSETDIKNDFNKSPKGHSQRDQKHQINSVALASVDFATSASQPLLLPSLSQHKQFIAALVSNHNEQSGSSSSTNNNYHYAGSSGNMRSLDFNSLDELAHPKDDSNIVEETTHRPPVFDFGMPRNITARSGQTAAINCRVEHLGDKSVSWIRKRDLHILTAGIFTYTSDERFKVIHTTDSKDWTLHLKYAQPRDSGVYECQVSTEPKMSMAFRLNVIVTPPDAKASIIGPSDLYVKVGSAITLTCLVKQPSSALDIGPIYWYRGPYILTPFVAHPNEAAIDMQRISMESQLGEKLQSRLRIANAQTGDSGNYTCMPTTAEAASVLVNVINDESPAAMQKSAAASFHRYSIMNTITTMAIRCFWHSPISQIKRCSTSLSLTLSTMHINCPPSLMELLQPNQNSLQWPRHLWHPNWLATIPSPSTLSTATPAKRITSPIES